MPIGLAIANETKTNNVNEINSNSKSINNNSNSLKEHATNESQESDSTSFLSLDRSSNSLRKDLERKIAIEEIKFLDKLNNTLRANTRADRTCFSNITRFLANRIRDGKSGFDIFEKALGYAKEAKSGDKPNALFMSLMKNQIGYRKNHG